MIMSNGSNETTTPSAIETGAKKGLIQGTVEKPVNKSTGESKRPGYTVMVSKSGQPLELFGVTWHSKPQQLRMEFRTRQHEHSKYHEAHLSLQKSFLDDALTQYGLLTRAGAQALAWFFLATAEAESVGLDNFKVDIVTHNLVVKHEVLHDVETTELKGFGKYAEQ
jgi:hypothetical protein